MEALEFGNVFEFVQFLVQFLFVIELPNAPQHVKANVSSQQTGHGNITHKAYISWMPPLSFGDGEMEGYIVKYGVKGNYRSTVKKVTKAPTNKTFVCLENLSPYLHYEVRVFAKSTIGRSGYMKVSFTIFSKYIQNRLPYV